MFVPKMFEVNTERTARRYRQVHSFSYRFQYLSSVIDRLKEQKVSKYTIDLNNTNNQLDLIDREYYTH